MQKLIKTMIFLFLAMSSMVLPSMAEEAPRVVVGRVSQVEGDLLRYVPDENDWVAVVRDAPFGTEDTLYSGDGGRAELAVPNGSWIRVGNSTQLQFINLETDLTETDVASGIARFYNKGSRTVIKATCPYGYVLADPGTAFDIYVGDNSVEVVALQGEVSFVHSATGTRYDISAGSSSILADENQVSSGEGTVDPDWDQWNADRDNFWAEKARERGLSAAYLPPDLENESYALEENGRWERVPYEGSPRWFWRPTTVAFGWSPFTVGRWTDWDGDQTWIPSEPFGYVTHHYGNWVYISNNWYWAPPVANVQIGLPLLNIGFYWNPGRVSWIHSGAYVGWVPLAPRETYYGYRNWGGPHVTVVNNINILRININVRNYAYARHAIVVNQSNFYGVNSYRNVRMTNINTTFINNFRAAPVVNNTVIANYRTNTQRHNFANIPVREKPHNSVIKRIQRNDAIIAKDRGRRENAALIQQQVKRIPQGRVIRDSRVAVPKITNRIVPAKEVNRPESAVRFQQKEIKKRAKGAAESRPGQIGRPSQSPKPTEQARPERVQPTRPALQQPPVKTRVPEQVAPRIVKQPEKPAQIRRPQQPVPTEQARPERVQPTRPALQQPPVKTRGQEQVAPRIIEQPEKPTQIRRSQQPVPTQSRPERVQPTRPALQQPPVKTRVPEQVAPRIVKQPEKPAQIRRPQQPLPAEQARPERVQPTRPTMQQPPVKTRGPERVAPQITVKPVKPEKYVVDPAKGKPAKPGEKQKSKKDLEKEKSQR